jgi:hypothetical protein
VKFKFSTTTAAEIALQIGTSCTMVIKFPVVGGFVEEVVLGSVVVVEELQLVNNPASSATPIIFTSLPWCFRLKSLLQLTSGNGAWLRQPATPNYVSMVMSADPRLFFR